MTLADDPQNPKPSKKLSKSVDAITALREAMEQRLQKSHETPPASGEPESLATTAPAEPAAPPPEPAAAQPAEEPVAYDPAAWPRILMHIAERSQKLVLDYAARAKTAPLNPPAFDPAHVSEAFTELSARLVNDPQRFVDAQIALWQGYAKIWQTALARMQGQKTEDTVAPVPNDKRFQDQEWQTNWLFDLLKQFYLLTAQQMKEVVQVEAQKLDPKLARKLEFITRQMADAISPSNFWATNPEVLRAVYKTGGESLIKGLENLLTDLENGKGDLRIRMTDISAFHLGGNLATTPGKVIYQNTLIQLIQYSPSTPEVHRVPLLILPPWINKFYILDLREKNSFIRYLVAQGFTVFCVSWVNPDARHAEISFDDYMTEGALTAMREVARATGADSINMLGYCIGGTLLASTLAYLNHFPNRFMHGSPPPLGGGEARAKLATATEAGWGVSHENETIVLAEPTPHPTLPPRGEGYTDGIPNVTSATYLVTMTDFSEPGDLGAFIDEDLIKIAEEKMAKQGYLDAASMATVFNMLRSNDLIWNYVVNNYLLGKDPTPFDILYWNTDSTNMPAAMQRYYIREMYVANNLVKPNGLTLKGVPIDLRTITVPTFMLSTREDHIAPWKSTYAATHLYQGPVTFVLAASGHIAGVVNPPASGKYGYWTNPTCPATPDEWLKGAEQHKGSWWPEWVKWLSGYAGDKVPARAVTDGIEDAPGSYVKVRAV